MSRPPKTGGWRRGLGLSGDPPSSRPFAVSVFLVAVVLALLSSSDLATMAAAAAAAAIGETTSAAAALQHVKSWTLYHATNDRPFRRRGIVELGLVGEEEGGETTTSVASTTVQKNNPAIEGRVRLVIRNDDGALADADDMLSDLVSPDGWYRLKLVPGEGEGDNSRGVVHATVPGCQVRRSNFRCVISLWGHAV